MSKLTLIKEPNNSITDIDKTYRRQNELLIKMRYLNSAFDGIILGNWEEGNTKIPYIKKGSICEFDGSLFEAKEDVYLTPQLVGTPFENRYIRLRRVNPNGNISVIGKSNDDYLVAELTDIIPQYDETFRGFYDADLVGTSYEDAVWIATKKTLRVYMKYTSGKYTLKSFWVIDDVNRYGSSLKRHLVYFKQPGSFNFQFPLEAESIKISIAGAGAGSGGFNSAVNATDGGESYIELHEWPSNNKITIARCKGGKAGENTVYYKNGLGGPGGSYTVNSAWQNGNYFYPGESGITGGRGGLLQGNTLAENGNGGSGTKYASYGTSGGGGSGCNALITVNRTAIGDNKTIYITVGSKGLAGGSDKGIGRDGQNGSVVIEYFTRGQSA